MSSTNRGAVRNANDFYATPSSAFTPLQPWLRQMPTSIVFWEPACGDRRLIVALEATKFQADGGDLQDGYDFLQDTVRRDAILTNPPFSLAFEFCQHARKLSDNVFMLLRLNFLASLKRKAWFVENEPSALFILSKRPCFTNDGATDSCDYAWFAWTQFHTGIHHL